MASANRIRREADLEPPDIVREEAPVATAIDPTDLSPGSLVRLQQTAGNQFVQRLIAEVSAGGRQLQRKPPPTTIDFEPEVITVPTHTVPKSAEGSGASEINQLVADQATNLRSTQVALLTGIDNFAEYQKFASSNEAKADYAGVVVKFATKQLLEDAVKAIGKELPGFDKVYKITFGLVEELEKEHARALKAGSEVAARDFIVQYRQLITDFFNERIGKVPAVREGLQDDFAKLANPNPTPPKKGDSAPGPGLVVGDQAGFLNGLRKAFFSYKVPTADLCLKALTEAWVLKAEDQLMSRGGGDLYYDGRINLSMHITKDGDAYEINEWPKAGQLASPRAAKTIDALTYVFQSGVVKSTNDLEILKVLTIDVEDEIPWGFNDHYIVRVQFRNPERIEQMSTIPSPVDSDTVPKADGVGNRAIRLVWPEAAKLGVTKLSAVEEGEKV
jgi:hypothetical protein